MTVRIASSGRVLRSHAAPLRMAWTVFGVDGTTTGLTVDDENWLEHVGGFDELNDLEQSGF